MGGDQIIVHIGGMRCHIAKPRQAIDVAQGADQLAKAGARIGIPVGVDVLPEQGDFGGARRRQAPRLGHDLAGGARIFGAARIRHHAEGAIFAAAFHD